MALIDAPEDSWTEVGRYVRGSDANAAALVLASAGISSRLAPLSGAIALLVAEEDALRAGYELAEYDRENRRRPAPALRPLREGVDAALAYATVLIVIYVASVRQLFGFDWLAAGSAEAGQIRAGEIWRTLTALTLHADLGHIASNVFAGAMLGLYLAQFLGPGLTWLAILLAGGLGNGLNALAVPPQHDSIGASTSVFAALGLLAALVWREGLTNWAARGLRSWRPLAAGVMLLAFLGFGGERTDFGAHIAGFALGVLGGVALAFALPRIPKGRRAQVVYGALTLALLTAAWLVALTET